MGEGELRALLSVVSALVAMVGVSFDEGLSFTERRAAITLEIQEVRCVRIADEVGTKSYVGL